MGKFTLMLVLAAVAAGSLVAFNARRTANASAGLRAGSQQDLLARQIAESGLGLALTSMVGDDGFVDPNLPSRTYDGGRFEVEYVGSADRRTATLTVRGHYGGAVHTIQGSYEFDPMAYPGPIWLDVPNATSTVTGAPTVDGGMDNLAVQFDPRTHAELGMESVAPLAGIQADFTPDMAVAGAAFATPSAGAWPALLEDLNVDNVEGLYQAALSVMDAGDRTAPAQTIGSAVAWMGRTAITRVQGALTVASGGRLRGEGVLLVEGPLEVLAGGRMDWNGLVVVRSEEQTLPVRLVGDATITGGLVVGQQAFPPGGHLDVSVWRNPGGLPSPAGGLPSAAPWDVGGPFPWYQHTHRFDQTQPEGRTLYLLESGGAGRQEDVLRFHEALRDAGSADVYLEFENEAHHGHSVVRFQTSGNAPVRATVRDGFPDGVHATGQPHRTTTFRADDLQSLTLDIRSLLALRDRFDGEGGCAWQWPYCIGNDWGRNETLRLRLVRANDGRVLYETAMYWHMRADEVAQHELDLAAWRAEVASGTGFGTHLTLGDAAEVTFALAPIARLADRLGFDGNEVIVVNTTTTHDESTAPAASERQAAPPTAAPATAAATTGRTTGSTPAGGTTTSGTTTSGTTTGGTTTGRHTTGGTTTSTTGTTTGATTGTTSTTTGTTATTGTTGTTGTTTTVVTGTTSTPTSIGTTATTTTGTTGSTTTTTTGTTGTTTTTTTGSTGSTTTRGGSARPHN